MHVVHAVRAVVLCGIARRVRHIKENPQTLNLLFFSAVRWLACFLSPPPVTHYANAVCRLIDWRMHLCFFIWKIARHADIEYSVVRVCRRCVCVQANESGKRSCKHTHTHHRIAQNECSYFRISFLFGALAHERDQPRMANACAKILHYYSTEREREIAGAREREGVKCMHHAHIF